MNPLALQVGQAVLVVALAPLLTGIVRKVKARLLRRRGASVFQPYRDLLRLTRKDAVLAENASSGQARPMQPRYRFRFSAEAWARDAAGATSLAVVAVLSLRGGHSRTDGHQRSRHHPSLLAGREAWRQ